ncbi:MAG: UDP-glucuronic acid decarboxylase family protein [Elusimicrobiota bacterium]|nr:UDP-glucuronic acid decarboxylase family protein [Elusimicrobiota bacterium]
MRIVITGAAGFLGSHLSRYFINKGHTVIGIDNFITGNIDNISDLFKTKKFEFIEYNVVNYIHVPGKIDAVLHFASPASPIDYLKFPIPTLKVGALGTYRALGFAKAKKAKFMIASTSEVYGDPLINPQVETYWGNVNPIGPRGVYDEAKRYAEALTMAYHRYHKMPVSLLRIFNTYGPNMRLQDGRAVPNFMVQALKNKPITVYGKGDQTRSLCYVSDLVRGIYKLLQTNINTPVNIGNPHEVSILKLAQTIKKLTKSKSKIIFKKLPQDDPQVRRPDISVAKSKLKWQPKVSLEEGLKETVKYFKAAL